MGGKDISEERGEHNGLGDVEKSMTEALYSSSPISHLPD